MKACILNFVHIGITVPSQLSACILLFFLLTLLTPDRGIAETEKKKLPDCVSCHAAVWNDIQNMPYVHKPDRAADCKYCHLSAQDFGDDKLKAYLDMAKWVAVDTYPAREHWLEFSADKRGATALVEAKWPGKTALRDFSLPAFDELSDLLIDENAPLQIDHIKVLEVARWIVYSATIAWETDRPADSQVLYGLRQLDQSSLVESQLTTKHVVTLNELRPGRTYHFKVKSTDAAGHSSESNEQTVVVKTTPRPLDEKASGVETKELDLSFKLYRHNGKYLVLANADREVSIRLGTLPKKYDSNDPGDATQIFRHPPMNSPEMTAILICYKCHATLKDKPHHSVNVYPKAKMIIPRGYATLPDGRLTCESCHEPHASDNEFRLLKADKTALCQGCHRDK